MSLGRLIYHVILVFAFSFLTVFKIAQAEFFYYTDNSNVFFIFPFCIAYNSRLILFFYSILLKQSHKRNIVKTLNTEGFLGFLDITVIVIIQYCYHTTITNIYGGYAIIIYKTLKCFSILH